MLSQQSSLFQFAMHENWRMGSYPVFTFINIDWLKENFNFQIPSYNNVWNTITSIVFLPRANVHPGCPTPLVGMTCDAKMYCRFSVSLRAKAHIYFLSFSVFNSQTSKHFSAFFICFAKCDFGWYGLATSVLRGGHWCTKWSDLLLGIHI